MRDLLPKTRGKPPAGEGGQEGTADAAHRGALAGRKGTVRGLRVSPCMCVHSSSPRRTATVQAASAGSFLCAEWHLRAFASPARPWRAQLAIVRWRRCARERASARRGLPRVHTHATQPRPHTHASRHKSGASEATLRACGRCCCVCIRPLIRGLPPRCPQPEIPDAAVLRIPNWRACACGSADRASWRALVWAPFSHCVLTASQGRPFALARRRHLGR